jgi:protein SPA2
MDSGYGGSSTGRRPSEDRNRRPPDDDYGPSRKQDDNPYSGDNYQPGGYNAVSPRRKPPQDPTSILRKPDDRDRDMARRPSISTSDSVSTTNAQQTATATSGMIVPNKSTIAEEDIEIPYGREARDSSSTAADDRELMRGDGEDGEPESTDYMGGLSGLSGLSARLRGDDTDDGVGSGGGTRSGEDYFDKLSFGGRTSV